MSALPGVFVVMVLGGTAVRGEILINASTTISTSTTEAIRVVDGVAPPTVVDVGAGVWLNTVSAFDTSVINSSAEVIGRVNLQNSTTLNATGAGRVTEINAFDTSTVNLIAGGSRLYARNQSIINCASGWLSVLEAYDSAYVSLTGGCNDLTANDTSEVHIVPGATGEMWIFKGNSNVYMFGGMVDFIHVRENGSLRAFGAETRNSLYANDHSRVEISGGQYLFGAGGFADVSISGGVFVDPVAAMESSRVMITGGVIPELKAGMELGEHSSVITVAGWGFNYPYGSILDRSGRLNGLLASGEPIDAAFTIYDGASIVLVPEPGVMGGVGLAVAGLLGRRRRG